MKFLPNLNPLRFVLSFIVMIYHVPQFFQNRELPYFDDLPIFHKGEEAVYVFFVLSGFLIIRLLYLEKQRHNKVSLKNFFMRRILRIWPLYFLILFSGLLYYNAILPGLGYRVAEDSNWIEVLLLCLFFLPNLAKELYQPGGIIEVLWSIGIEEQFYLMIAPLIAFVRLKSVHVFLILFTIVFFALFASNVFPFLETYNFLFFYFTAGGGLAILQEKYNIADKISKPLKTVILLLFIIFFFTDVFSSLPWQLYHLTGALLFSLFILSISFNPLKIVRNKSFNYLGEISYGIYMFHGFAIQLAGLILLRITGTFELSPIIVILLSYILVILFTIIISHYSFQYFEKPFLKLKSKFRKHDIN